MWPQQFNPTGYYPGPGMFPPPPKQVKKPSDAFKPSEMSFQFQGEKLVLMDGSVIGTLPFRAVKNTVYDSHDNKIGRIHKKDILLDYGNTYFVAGNIDKRGVIRIKDKVCNTPIVAVSGNEDMLKEILLQIQSARADIVDLKEDLEDRGIIRNYNDDEDYISNVEQLTETVNGKFVPEAISGLF